MTTTEDELIALAVAVGLLDSPADPADLTPTLSADVWYDPATGTLVRVPAGARPVVDEVIA